MAGQDASRSEAGWAQRLRFEACHIIARITGYFSEFWHIPVCLPTMARQTVPGHRFRVNAKGQRSLASKRVGSVADYSLYLPLRDKGRREDFLSDARPVMI
ncbi:hypothetical protein ACEUZ9_005429 [Paracoccus litorisediminis]|jgi:hypothetical protein|uniref:Uncharacterized protein n=1 Tax=Paracoccus litorisediminis TaxID=2006130 RepID=A0A844HPT4_9RHOB|nr:hypothetical protein [Paracoccus litorisediminis]MTH61068.1 hypothetical protein [Paracoccus litorisediminis]